MNRLLHIFMLIALIPAFFMPAVLPVCLKNGLGSSCCGYIEQGDCCTASSADSCCMAATEDDSQDELPPCCRKKKPEEPAPVDDSKDIIESKCSCCLEVENLTDELDQTKTVATLTMPPATLALDVQLPKTRRCDYPQIVQFTSHDPPRLLPLMI